MKQLAWLFKWLLKAAIFFTLFAFALNNQGDVTVHFFFGTRWTAPMVLVVLITFAAGVTIGVLGMVPRWWRHRRAARQAVSALATVATETDKTPIPPPHGL
jgi:lipopolysaccharide assembly protein A